MLLNKQAMFFDLFFLFFLNPKICPTVFVRKKSGCIHEGTIRLSMDDDDFPAVRSFCLQRVCIQHVVGFVDLSVAFLLSIG